MWLLPAINLVKSNWKYLIGFLIIAFIWGHGNSVGKSAIRSQWNAEKLQMAMDIQAEKDRLADEANKKSAELEVALSKMEITNRKLNARVKDEIRKNDSYRNCIVTIDGLHAYNDSIAKAGDTR